MVRIVATLALTAFAATGCAKDAKPSKLASYASLRVVSEPAAVFALKAPEPLGNAQVGGTAQALSQGKKSNEPLPSYVEAMLKPAELGDLTLEGGEKHLSSEEVTNVMNDNVNDIFEGCVLAEIKRNDLSRVNIKMVISGKGKITGATTKPGTKTFQRCVAKKLLKIEFPTFAAVRMGAEYGFRLE